MTKKTKQSNQLRCERSFTTPGVGNFESGKLYEVVDSESARYGQVPSRLRGDWIKQGKFSEASAQPVDAPAELEKNEDA